MTNEKTVGNCLQRFFPTSHMHQQCNLAEKWKHYLEKCLEKVFSSKHDEINSCENLHFTSFWLTFKADAAAPTTAVDFLTLSLLASVTANKLGVKTILLPLLFLLESELDSLLGICWLYLL